MFHYLAANTKTLGRLREEFDRHERAYKGLEAASVLSEATDQENYATLEREAGMLSDRATLLEQENADFRGIIEAARSACQVFHFRSEVPEAHVEVVSLLEGVRWPCLDESFSAPCRWGPAGAGVGRGSIL